MNTQAEIVELLGFMFTQAAKSHRRELVLDPYPTVYGGASGKEMLFHPSEKDYLKVERSVDELLTIRAKYGPSAGAGWTCQTSLMSAASGGLMQWVVVSNRT